MRHDDPAAEPPAEGRQLGPEKAFAWEGLRTQSGRWPHRHVGEAIHGGLQADGSLERVAGLLAARQKENHEHRAAEQAWQPR